MTFEERLFFIKDAWPEEGIGSQDFWWLIEQIETLKNSDYLSKSWQIRGDEIAKLQVIAENYRAILLKFVRVAEIAGTFGLGAEYVIDPSPCSMFGMAAKEARAALEEK